MDKSISDLIALSPGWEAALDQVKRRRSKLHYKPAALLVMLDMMDAGASNDGRMPFREYDKRFHELMRSVDTQGKDNGWQPFLHLATGEQVWDLYRSGELTDLDVLLANRTRANLQAHADEARIRSHLLPYLRDESGREAVRQAVLRILADDRPGDSQRLRDVYLSHRSSEHEPTSSPEVSDALMIISQVAGRRQRGQGYRISPQARRAIEQHAMQKAEAYYRKQGWDVDTSVALTECFDMRCTRGTTELHVEVKGTTSLGEQIVLTRNEVKHAGEYPAVALAIVKNIEIEPGEPVTAHGGELGIIDPWRIADGMLDCLGFSYDVPVAHIRRPKPR